MKSTTRQIVAFLFLYFTISLHVEAVSINIKKSLLTKSLLENNRRRHKKSKAMAKGFFSDNKDLALKQKLFWGVAGFALTLLGDFFDAEVAKAVSDGIKIGSVVIPGSAVEKAKATWELGVCIYKSGSAYNEGLKDFGEKRSDDQHAVIYATNLLGFASHTEFFAHLNTHCAGTATQTLLAENAKVVGESCSVTEIKRGWFGRLLRLATQKVLVKQHTQMQIDENMARLLQENQNMSVDLANQIATKEANDNDKAKASICKLYEKDNSKPLCPLKDVNMEIVVSGWEKIKSALKAIATGVKCVFEIDSIRDKIITSLAIGIASTALTIVTKIFTGFGWIVTLFKIIKAGYDLWTTIKEARKATDERMKYFGYGKALGQIAIILKSLVARRNFRRQQRKLRNIRRAHRKN